MTIDAAIMTTIVTTIDRGYRVNSKFGHICERYSPLNMLDLDLNSPGHFRSKTMVPNEPSHMTSYPLTIVTLWLS